MLLLAVLFCDVGRATIGFTNLANYSVQRFLHSYLILNIIIFVS